MTTIALIIALGAAALLLTAGYLFGVQRAFGAREQLRAQTLRQAQDIELLREELAHKTTEQEQSLRTTIELLRRVRQRTNKAGAKQGIDPDFNLSSL